MTKGSDLSPDSKAARDAQLAEASSWATDRSDAARRSQRTAWIIASVAVAIALLEALALVLLLPLKTTEPYMLLVDRQTGNVEAVDPASRAGITADDALVRSMVVQYVTARESFDIDNIQSDYRKVALWSAGDARTRYMRAMQAGNPESPLSALPRQAVVAVTIRSISSLSPTSALVRFSSQQSEDGSGRALTQHWASIVHWRFSDAAMREDDRLLNPLGFQVTRYRRSAETLVEDTPRADIPRADIPRADALPVLNGSEPGARALDTRRSAPGGLAPTAPTGPAAP